MYRMRTRLIRIMRTHALSGTHLGSHLGSTHLRSAHLGSSHLRSTHLGSTLRLTLIRSELLTRHPHDALGHSHHSHPLTRVLLLHQNHSLLRMLLHHSQLHGLTLWALHPHTRTLRLLLQKHHFWSVLGHDLPNHSLLGHHLRLWVHLTHLAHHWTLLRLCCGTRW